MEIRIPNVAEGVTNGVVILVTVQVGDAVEVDQTLLELETDKAVVEIPSPCAGTITEVRAKEGDVVGVGDVIMVCSTTADTETPPAERAVAAGGGDESAKAQTSPLPSEPSRPTSPIDGLPRTVAAAATPEAHPPLPPAPASAPPAPDPDAPIDLSTVRTGDRVAPAAPSVRRLARELGVDIYQVQGSGPAGRISEEDVRAFVRETMRRVTGGSAVVTGEFPGLHAQRPLPDFSRWGEVAREPLSRVREITADAMSYAWSTIPMVTQQDRADVTELEAFRREFNRRAAPEAKLTMTAILLKVVATALRTFPHLNSSLDLARKELILKRYVHIGVAVDTPGGLLVPVLRDVDQKGIAELAEELNALALRTRARRVSPAELQGGSFTISNLGGIGGTGFSPVVYAPQVAILGVSRAEKVPVWTDAGVEGRLLMPLSLSYDHRVVDGAEGARFTRWIADAIAHPLRLLL